MLAFIAENGPDLLGRLDVSERELADQIRATEQTLTALRRRQGNGGRLRNSVERTSNSTGGPVMLNVDLIQFSALAVGAPQDGPEQEQWIENHMRENLATFRPHELPTEPINDPYEEDIDDGDASDD